ncbi:MAG: TrkH family potassium uptake protein [Bacteroidales bacterium]|nr:TrkH family potassium uptake protein [Bacteroidales bacterium]MDZ4205040.1 TrkH family potassium uptake protein [Bacteroidales bacterium]
MTLFHHRIVIKSVSLFVIVAGAFMLVCLPVSLAYSENAVNAILLSSGVTLGAGLTGWFLAGKFNKEELGKRESYLIVVLTWIGMAFFGALPYLFSGAIPDLTDAFFESISGLTTTGASILNDIEAVPKSILFWRSLTHWIGGMGIVVFSIAILPIFGIGGMQLFVAEVPGPTKDKLHPRIKETARRLWGIYVILTFAQTALLMAGNMDLFDALCHSFSTVSSGGFSTRNLSMGAFSDYSQYITIIFMILAGTNFTLHYLLLLGRFKEALKNEELWLYLSVIGLAVITISSVLVLNEYASFERSFRDSLFQVTSIVTCTGFGTADYMLWPKFSWFLIFLLMFVGGCAGSTAGGIKVIRHLLLFKNSFLEFRSILHPAAYIPLLYNGKPVSQGIRSNILTIFFLYLLTFSIGSLLIIMTGSDKITAMGSVVSCMGNIGPGLAATGPASNYFLMSVAGKWILSALMLIGRLELLTVYVLFTRSFWRK